MARNARRKCHAPVRGDDLLDSTPRQMLLYESLGIWSRLPVYYHLPLVVGPDGRRLAKRHGDSRLSHYRSRGVQAARMLALLADWCGIARNRDTLTLSDLLAGLFDQFELSRLPRDRIIFDPAEEAKLF